MVLSRLVGCATVSEVNTQLKPDMALAHAWNLTHWADQSTLMRTLDTLTQLNIGQVRTAATTIWRAQSQTWQHDWRRFLWLDVDLSGLPCSPRAEASPKGYFSGKKYITGRQLALVMPCSTVKRYGRMCCLAIDILPAVCNLRCWPLKLP